MSNDGLDNFINNCTITDFSSSNEGTIRGYIADYFKKTLFLTQLSYSDAQRVTDLIPKSHHPD